MVKILMALPVGSRRIRDQREGLDVLDLHPALLDLRSDRAARIRAVWRALVLRADWSTMTVTVTWDLLAGEADVSRSTIARAIRWLCGAGLLGVVHTGASAAAIGGDTNRAPTYVLAVPFALVDEPAEPAVDELDTPTCSEGSVHVQNAREEVDQERQAPLRGLDQRSATRTRPTEAILAVQPTTRRARLDAAEALRWHSIALRPLTARMLRHLLRPVFDAGWSPRDVLHALDFRPTGAAWTYTTAARVPAAWVRHRLAAWRGPDGEILPSRSQRARADAEALRHARTVNADRINASRHGAAQAP